MLVVAFNLLSRGDHWLLSSGIHLKKTSAVIIFLGTVIQVIHDAKQSFFNTFFFDIYV
jgi:hypothetical protein